MFKRFSLSLFMVLALVFSFSATAQALENDDAQCQESPLPETCTETVEDGEVDGTDKEETEEEGAVEVKPKGLDPDTEVLGRQQLPVTGAETVTIAAGGALLALAGLVLVRRSNAVTA